MSVVVVLRDFVFRDVLSDQHIDLLAYSLPYQCFMGRSLAAGSIPDWNPFATAGAPFAADPQSGWMYAPVMLLYTLLSCDAAMRAFIVLQPLLAGLGMYWFLRGERAARWGATLGGITLALACASSFFAIYLPFVAVVAWIPWLLGAVARCLGARTWPARVLWITMVALAWGQLTAAFMSFGLVLGTLSLAFYGTAKSVIELRSGAIGRRELAVLWGLLILALPLVNAAFLLPRVAYIPRTNIGLGYEALRRAGAELLGTTAPEGPRVGPAAGPPWVLKLATSRGTYLGGLVLIATGAALWNRACRPLVIAMVVLAALCFLLSMNAVARALAPVLEGLPFSEFYLQYPWRLALGLFVPLVVLAVFGLEAVVAETRWARSAVMLAPGLLVWGLLPLAFGARVPALALAATGAGLGLALLMAATKRPALLVIAPALVALELSANALIGQGSEGSPSGLDGVPYFMQRSLRTPEVDADAYLRRGPVAQALDGAGAGRYLSFAPRKLAASGYLFHQHPRDWPLMANQRSMLFELEEVQGYSSVQVLRFWEFVRATSSIPLDHNAAVFPRLSPALLDLLQVTRVVAPVGRAPDHTSVELAREGKWAVFSVADPAPRATFHSAWEVAGGHDAALEAVTAPGFDPARDLVLERAPSVPRLGGSGPSSPVDYESLGPGAARMTFEAEADGVLLIRNVHDVNWRAEVDGEPVPLLVADFLLQGVAVPEGRHTVTIVYDDPWIERGLVGSGVTLALLVAGAWWSRRLVGRDRRASARRHAQGAV